MKKQILDEGLFDTDVLSGTVNAISSIGNLFNEDISEESFISDSQKDTVGLKNGFSDMIGKLIIDEYEAIEGYNNAILQAKIENIPDIVSVLEDIQHEENVHVGQLQELLKLFNEGAKKVEDGIEEGKQQIEGSKVTPEEVELEESYDEVYKSFKEIEKTLNDGESVTTTIEKICKDNKGNPDYEEAYKKWISEQ